MRAVMEALLLAGIGASAVGVGLAADVPTGTPLVQHLRHRRAAVVVVAVGTASWVAALVAINAIGS